MTFEKNDFPNPKLRLPKELENKESFVAIDDYLEIVEEYIYTDINLDIDVDDILHSRAWILKIISANLLRSLYIRNSFVDALNSRNIFGMYLPLKAWFEIVGLLASILHLLDQKLSQEEMHKRLASYALGDKGSGSMRVGSVEAKSVASMMEKADKYVKKLERETSNRAGSKGDFFVSFYDNASNPSHPSYSSQELAGRNDDKSWVLRSPEEIEELLITTLPQYGGLLMSPLFIGNLLKKIFQLEKDNFSQVKCNRYFS